MNFVMGLAHHRVYATQCYNSGVWNPKVCGSIPNWSHAGDKWKNIFLHLSTSIKAAVVAAEIFHQKFSCPHRIIFLIVFYGVLKIKGFL